MIRKRSVELWWQNSSDSPVQEARKRVEDLETEIKEMKKELNSCIQEAGAIQKAITATVGSLPLTGIA